MLLYQTTWYHILQDNNGNTKIHKNIKTNVNPLFRKWYCEHLKANYTEATCNMLHAVCLNASRDMLHNFVSEQSWLPELPSTSVILICWISLSSLSHGQAQKYCTKINLLLTVMVIKTMLWNAQKWSSPHTSGQKKKCLNTTSQGCYQSGGDPPHHLCD